MAAEQLGVAELSEDVDEEPGWKVIARSRLVPGDRVPWCGMAELRPLRDQPSYWAMVFPLGMSGVAAERLRAAVELDTFRWLPRLVFVIALLAWIATAAGRATTPPARHEVTARAENVG